MVTNIAYNQNFFNDEEPNIRPATIISSVVHFIIFISAIYGLPNFNRKLPPDFIEIPVEILKVVDETNIEIKEKITQEDKQKLDFNKENIKDKTPEKS